MRKNVLGKAVLWLLAAILAAGVFACDFSDNKSDPKESKTPDDTAPAAPTNESGEVIHIPVELPSKLCISEVSPANKSVVLDGRIEDWFEIYNGSDKDVRLSDYFVSDDPSKPKAAALPEKTLKPGDYFVVVCGKDVSFSLSKSGETLTIADKKGNTVDRFVFPAVDDDCVIPVDGEISRNATPGNPNSAEFYGKHLNTADGLIISEAITSGDDSVEIKNLGKAPVSLGKLFISDKPSCLKAEKLPDKVLGPGELFVFTPKDFSLSSDGDSVIISDENGAVLCALYVPKLPAGMSMGLEGGKYVFFEKPTLGADNKGVSYPGISAAPTVNRASGIYNETQQIKLSSPDGGTIYFTLDGSEPTENSSKYGGEELTVSSTAIIKAINVKENYYKSAAAVFTYLFSLPAFENDILSVSVSENKFDEMYENYQSKIEIPCSVSYFKGGRQEFSVNCGIELNGQTSKSFDKKSFKLSFKTKYGASKLKYKVFDNLDKDEFDKLVLRSGGGAQASYAAYINDEFCTSIVTDSTNIKNVYSQVYKPVNLYINGEYFGLYFIREKVNEDFAAEKLGVSPDSVSVITEMSYIEYGNTTYDFDEIWEFVRTKDLRVKANYDYVEKRVCLESVADYYILESWCANFDSSNVRFFKSDENDGKWRFIYYDLDYAFAYPKNSPKVLLSKMNTETCDGLTCCNALFYKLFKTEPFRELFFERLELLCSNELAPKNTQKRWDDLYNSVYNDMKYNVERWAGHDCEPGEERTYNSMAEWEQVAAKVRSTYLSEEYLEQFKACFYEMGKELAK